MQHFVKKKRLQGCLGDQPEPQKGQVAGGTQRPQIYSLQSTQRQKRRKRHVMVPKICFRNVQWTPSSNNFLKIKCGCLNQTVLQKCTFLQMVTQYERQQKPDGSLGTRKTRLVARVVCKVEDVDISKIYASLIIFISTRTLLAVVTNFQLHLHQMHVVTEFLYGTLDEEVYMEQPA